MADKHSLNYDVRELKLGSSFTNNKSSQYHTIKYDFKPASVDVNKMATVDVGTNNQVTVTVPHLDGAGVPQTVFKGNQRPYTKECVLIIDRVTGEITLEKLSSNIQVKKTRQENTSKPRPLTPVTSDLLTNTTQRSTSRTRVATNRRTQTNHVAGPATQVNGQPRPAGAAPAKVQNMVRSPTRVKTSPPQAAPWAGGGNSTLASLPMIGLDEPSLAPRPEPRAPAPAPAPTPAPHDARKLPPHPLPPCSPAGSSSSSSSDSGSDSGSDSDSDAPSSHHPHPHPAPHPQPHPHHAAAAGNTQDYSAPAFKRTPSVPALPNDVLKDDLCLSESGSDSD